jgi:cytochrome c biogenesis protein CcdA
LEPDPGLPITLIGIVAQIVASRLRPPYKPPTEAQLAAEMPPPAWHVWLAFVLGILAAVFWVRALASLISSWHDPSSRVLRFSASVLLIAFGILACRLLLTPFQ